MVDTLTPAARSRNMARIKGRDTGPERRVRRALHAAGFRFRLHRRDLPGTPDLVLPRFRTAIFVHGCFWHRHADCPKSCNPKSRTEFWDAKFAANVERDRRMTALLAEQGWNIIVVWECQTFDADQIVQVITDLLPSGDLLPGRQTLRTSSAMPPDPV